MTEKSIQGFDSTLVLVSYILAIFTTVVGPLILWAIKKDDDPSTADGLRHVANFSISYTIYSIVAWITSVILIGFILGPIVNVLMLVFVIIGIVKAANGELYKPPFTLDFIK